MTRPSIRVLGGERLDRRLRDLQRRCRRAAARPVQIRIGWFSDLRYADGTPVAEVATRHEYGIGVPQRSFFASALPEMEQAARRLFRRDARADRPELSRRTAAAIGAECRDILQRSIEATNDPALDPETVRQRASGSLTVLIDTDRMRTSATWRVTIGKGGAA